MKNTLLNSTIVMALSVSSLVASASDFKKTNDNFETQICYVAATEGLESAKSLVESKGLLFRTFKKSVTCNGADLTSFAREYAQRSKNKEASPGVELVASNNDIESKICIEALTQGMEKTVTKYRINKDYIRCNGKPLPRFVKENKLRGSAVASIPE